MVDLTGTTMEGTDLYLVPLSAETKTLTLRPERGVVVVAKDSRLLASPHWSPDGNLHDTGSGASILPRAWLRLKVGRDRLDIPTVTARGDLWTARLDRDAAKVP